MPLEPGVGKAIGGSAVIVVVLVALIMNTGRDPVAPPAPAPPEIAPRPLPVAVPRAVEPADSASAPEPAEGRPDVAVSAEQLSRDYDANEVAADDKYRGAPLMVTGIIVATRKDVFGKPYVELAGGRMFQGVHARFAEGHTDSLSSFRRGDKIVVRCVGNNVVIGSPQLKDCVMQHHYRRE